jgi:hypothetical protein
MKRLMRTLAAAVLGAATLTVPTQWAEAGRLGGPASDSGTVAANQSVFFDVAFAAGEPAIVTVVGSGNSTLDLFVYDADGNVTPGAGGGDRKTAVVDVYRAGTFRVEIRNLGPSMNSFVVRTN